MNPAGDGFVTSLTDCTESGYFTFDDAVAQFTNITIGGKQYHLPSIEEWRSIVPQNMMHVHFTNTESHDDISETVTVQGTSITMTSDFRTGVSGVSSRSVTRAPIWSPPGGTSTSRTGTTPI